MTLIDNDPVLYCALAATIVLVVLLAKNRSHATLPLPPSPTSYPLIGNLPWALKSLGPDGLVKLGKDLQSDIISFSYLGKTTIFLNAAQPAIELFESRSAIYSNRACPPAFEKPSLMSAGLELVTFANYGEYWRKCRRMIHTSMNKQAVVAFYPSQQRQTRLLLQRLLDNADAIGTSEDLSRELFRTAAATLLQAVYGYDPQSSEDVFMVGTKDAIRHVTRAIIPFGFLVNTFPVLAYVPEWFPGVGWKKQLQNWGAHLTWLSVHMFDWCKNKIAAGEHDECIISSFLDRSERWDEDKSKADILIRRIGFSLAGAGPQTTSEALTICILAMLLFPDAQKKAQEEIDSVVGTSRLPTMEDRANLPYVGRLIKEIMRWRPMVPLVPAHVCAEENEYCGYRFPKDAAVIGNVWAMTRDERVYKNPSAFDPDRFIDPNLPAAPVFGWGRRICPGLHYAESSLFIIVVSILAAFNVTMHKDDLDSGMVLSAEAARRSASYDPRPFKSRLTPRSELYAELVRNGA